jgi:hypothetical protein
MGRYARRGAWFRLFTGWFVMCTFAYVLRIVYVFSFWVLGRSYCCETYLAAARLVGTEHALYRIQKALPATPRLSCLLLLGLEVAVTIAAEVRIPGCALVMELR